MPKDSTPRTLASLIEKPGSSAPTIAQGANKPGRALGAPQTICKGTDTPFTILPTSTVQICRRSASGCLLVVSILPTTTLVKAAATGCISSTSRPAMVKA